jgi:hypothetical protein
VRDLGQIGGCSEVRLQSWGPCEQSLGLTYGHAMSSQRREDVPVSGVEGQKPGACVARVKSPRISRNGKLMVCCLHLPVWDGKVSMINNRIKYSIP